jgi:ribosomal-protein-alanine N-acetyltransferase
MEALLTESEKRGIVKLSLEVRVSNEAAIKLYEKFGFQKVGTRPNFYREPRENAHIMTRDKP